MSSKEDNDSKESKEPDYDDDKDQLKGDQEKEIGELFKEETTTNQIFYKLVYSLSTAYQNILLFIVNPEVFISLGKGNHIDFGIGTKDLKESRKIGRQ